MPHSGPLGRCSTLPDTLAAVVEWGKVPWTLWAYALLTAGGIVQFLLLRVDDTRPVLIVGTIALVIAWTFFLLKGVRWVWIGTLIVSALGLLDTVILGPRVWWSLLLYAVPFGLLLAPTTRRYFTTRELVR